jgi:hypothetical protein
LKLNVELVVVEERLYDLERVEQLNDVAAVLAKLSCRVVT